MNTCDVQFQDVGASQIAFRKLGEGSHPLIFIHGWPLSGLTWRNAVSHFQSQYTCYVVDLPGTGDSKWTAETDFGMRNQANDLKKFAESQNLEFYSIVAHNTGATIGRQLSLIDAKKVKAMVCIATEIPNHRPPFIQMFQFTSYFPGVDWLTSIRMGSKSFIRSSQGFGGAFSNREYMDGDFHKLFIQPMIDSPHHRQGQRMRLRGIDWSLVDELAVTHSNITCPVLLLWGDNDRTFPIDLARAMKTQFKNAQFQVVPGAGTFMHEEFPQETSKACIDFLNAI